MPTYHEDAIPSAIAAPEVTKVALRLRYLIEECIPCELEETKITESHSRIITHSVVEAARKAGEVGDKDYNACVVYALLVNKRWFKKQAMLELWDADLHNIRAVACEVIAKLLYVFLCLVTLLQTSLGSGLMSEIGSRLKMTRSISYRTSYSSATLSL